MGVFELGKMTLEGLFKKPETVLYPFETVTEPVGFRGHIENDETKCILCSACSRACTTGCIEVDKKGSIWSIRPFACVQCGLCVEVCPKNCLTMEVSRTAVGRKRTEIVLVVPQKPKPERKPRPAAAAADGKAEPADDGPAAASKQAKARVPLPPELEAEIAKRTEGLDPERAEKVRAGLIARAERAQARKAAEPQPAAAQD
ncbi:MAG: 4Fe-4S binding protein, partial [Berryella intestinalis]|uniref:4Fe-4S dicluster domain-containing protein n=1 Tax=Berryella intestinalis TaxID=1531429 RepID=UPI002A755343